MKEVSYDEYVKLLQLVCVTKFSNITLSLKVYLTVVSVNDINVR